MNQSQKFTFKVISDLMLTSGGIVGSLLADHNDNINNQLCVGVE
jgi:hypothetical protein